MRCMFLAKYAHPDILTRVVYLSTRVKRPSNDDWDKLIRILNDLKCKNEILLKLELKDVNNLHCNVELSFGIHNDYRSHTGLIFSLGNRAICSESIKQKGNTRTSTVGVDCH